MGFYKNKKILVTGGTGLIGRPLVEMLINKGAKVRIASLDDPSRAHSKAEFKRTDLTKYENCIKACKDIEYVFHLAGIKGSPKMTKEKPASFFVPTILFNTNMMEAASQTGIERYLFTSTVGVYSPAEVFYENDVWKTFPSENDKFAGWAKRMGELQAQAYNLEDKWDKIAIVRPANVYGPYDNFDPENAMVIPSLIKRAVEGENPFVAWGDGSPIRDFIHAKDVAKGMLMALENCPGPEKPINLGSGTGYSIKNLVDTIINNLDYNPEVIWDTSKPSGDKKRLMDISRAKSLIGWEPKISLEEGVKEVMNWYKKNKDIIDKRYNVFREEKKNIMGQKSVLITGSSGGLGKELANIFRKNDYKIITHGRKGNVDIYGDLRDSDTINRLIKISKKNNLDVLVNNAGVLCPGLPLEKITDEQLNELIETNLIAPIKLTRGIYTFFVARGYGEIININSKVALRKSFQRTIYSATKGGLRGFSLGLQKEAKEKGIDILDFYLGKIENTKKIAEDIFKKYKHGK